MRAMPSWDDDTVALLLASSRRDLGGGAACAFPVNRKGCFVTEKARSATGWPHTLLRVTTAALVVLSLAQAVLAGSFLSGHYDSLKMHEVNAMLLFGVAVVQAVAVVFARRRGGPRPVLIVGLLLPLLIAGQIALGFVRVLGLHVLFGVLMIVGITQLAGRVWRSAAAQPTSPVVTQPAAPSGAQPVPSGGGTS